MAAIPVLTAFATAIVLLLLQKKRGLQESLTIVSLAVQLLLAGYILKSTFTEGVLTSFLGSWQTPLGIVIVVDKAAAILVVLALLVVLTASMITIAENRKNKESSPLKLPLILFLLTGIQLSFTTGDLFNLFVAFEVMLLSSFALMTLEGAKLEIKHAYPYVILNLLGSALFLAACGFSYSLFGTLNMAGISEAAAIMNTSPGGAFKVSMITALLALVFAIKAGMFPLYYWLPNSYPILPPAIGALYAGLLTKVGIYVLLRLTGTIMPHDQSSLYLLIAWLGAGTMFFGVLGAISKMGIREILSFHVLSQVGFMIVSLGFFTPMAFAATLFYMIHHIIVKSGLFLTASAVLHMQGTDDLKKTGGLWKSTPLLGSIFFILAFSLAGLPPLSGFWAKLWVLLEGLRLEHYALVAISLIASALTLASMLKICFGAFWNPRPDNSTGNENLPDEKWPGMAWLALFIITGASLAMIILVQPIWEMALSAGAELMKPEIYISAVNENALNDK